MNRQILPQDHLIVSPSASMTPCKLVQRLALLPLAVLVASGAVAPSVADPGRLAGSWSGGGWVAFATGNKEKARCRATYRRASKKSYKLRATCATASGKASQTATVYELARNRYRGSFYNTEYNVRGTIRVVVSGGSQSVSLAGDGASASLHLRRR